MIGGLGATPGGLITVYYHNQQTEPDRPYQLTTQSTSDCHIFASVVLHAPTYIAPRKIPKQSVSTASTVMRPLNISDSTSRQHQNQNATSLTNGKQHAIDGSTGHITATNSYLQYLSHEHVEVTVSKFGHFRSLRDTSVHATE